MTESELRIEFEKLFKNVYIYDCYDYACEARDCCGCQHYKDLYESYKRKLDYGKKKTV